MKILQTLAVIGSAVLLTAATGIAQEFLRADHKLLGHQTQTYQQHAQDKAQTLYYYGRAQQPLPKDEAKELLAGMKKDLAAAHKSLAQLKAEFAKNKDAVELIESIKKHHAKAHEVCEMAEEECAKEHGDKVVVSDCCSEMFHELEAAKEETAKLLKSLRIEKLESPKTPATKK